MSRRSKFILLLVLVAAVAVIVTRPLWMGESAAGNAAGQGDAYSDTGGSTVTNSGDQGANTQSPNVTGSGNQGSSDNTDNGGASAPKADDKAVAGTDLTKMVNSALGQGKPAVLVFTYNADCCPDTKEFFDKHRAAVKNIEREFSARANFVWIDVAIYNVVDGEGLNNLAKKYGVTAIPALVLVGADGKLLPVILGELDEKSVADKLAGLVKGK